MAFTHGKKSVFWLDNSGATLQNLSAYVTRVTFPRTVDVADVSTIGAVTVADAAKDFIVGLSDARISFEGKYDPTVDANLSGVLGQDATISFEYGPEGGTTGKIKYSGEAILVSYEDATGLDDAASWTAELQITGAVTRGTFA